MSDHLASPPNQQWIGTCPKNSPRQTSLKHPHMISPDCYQISNQPSTPATPNYSVRQSPGLSPSHMRNIRSTPSDPNNTFINQPTPVPSALTPTTPVQNPNCGRGYTDDVASQNTFASPSPVGSSGRQSSVSADQTYQNDPSSLRKLQQMTRDLPSDAVYDTSMINFAARNPKTSVFPSGNKRQRYNSIGYSESSGFHPHHSLVMNNNQSAYSFATPAPAGSFEVPGQHFANRGIPTRFNSTSSYGKDFDFSSFNASTGQGFPTVETSWPPYPSNVARQQSAPYEHYPGTVPNHHPAYSHPAGYNHLGGSFQSEPNLFDQAAFPPSLSGNYPQSNLPMRSFSSSSHDFPSSDPYGRHTGFSLHSNPVHYQSRPPALNAYHHQQNDAYYRT